MKSDDASLPDDITSDDMTMPDGAQPLEELSAEDFSLRLRSAIAAIRAQQPPAEAQRGACRRAAALNDDGVKLPRTIGSRTSGRREQGRGGQERGGQGFDVLEDRRLLSGIAFWGWPAAASADAAFAAPRYEAVERGGDRMATEGRQAVDLLAAPRPLSVQSPRSLQSRQWDQPRDWPLAVDRLFQSETINRDALDVRFAREAHDMDDVLGLLAG